MKRIIALLSLFASMCFAGSLPAWASCSNASLRGSYGFERHGINPRVGHIGVIGVITFDGNGNLSGVQTDVAETRGISIIRDTFTGTYEVNPDCAGSAVSGSTTLDFVIVSDEEVFAITTTKGPTGAQRVVTWVLKKQLPQECSNASLRGSYGFERKGFNPAVGHVGGIGAVTFDGNGNLSGMQTNVTETIGISRNTFTGTYEVNPDCTGSAVSGSTTVDFVIVSENEVFVISTNQDPAGAQRVVTWVFKKQLPQEGDLTTAAQAAAPVSTLPEEDYE